MPVSYAGYYLTSATACGLVITRHWFGRCLIMYIESRMWAHFIHCEILGFIILIIAKITGFELLMRSLHVI